ncbi:MAG: hypothetical protein WA154_11075 [Moraxellaceae bacterium]
MDSIKIELKPRTADYSVKLPDDMGTALVANANFSRPDGSFSGLGLSLQASPLKDCNAPTAVDAEMFFGALGLVNASHDLLAALRMARGVIATALKASAPDWFETEAEVANHTAIKQIDTVIAKATRRPLHDETSAEAERLQDAADHARKSAVEERLIGGAA